MTSRTSNQGTADTAIVQRLTEQACPRDGVQVRLGKRLDAIKDRPTVLLLRVDAELLSRFEADLGEPRAVVRTHALGLAHLVTDYFTATLGSRGLRPRLVRVWTGVRIRDVRRRRLDVEQGEAECPALLELDEDSARAGGAMIVIERRSTRAIFFSRSAPSVLQSHMLLLAGIENA